MSDYWQVVKQTAGRVFRGSKHSVAVITESIDRQATIQKLASRMRGLERERYDLIGTIGKKVYSLHQRDKVRNRDVLNDCVRIDEIGQQREDLQQQIEQIRRQAAAGGEEIVVEIEDEESLTDEEAAAPEEEVAAPEEEVAAPEEEVATPEEEEEVATEPPGEEQQPEPIEPEPPDTNWDEPDDSQQY